MISNHLKYADGRSVLIQYHVSLSKNLTMFFLVCEYVHGIFCLFCLEGVKGTDVASRNAVASSRWKALTDEQRRGWEERAEKLWKSRTSKFNRIECVTGV